MTLGYPGAEMIPPDIKGRAKVKRNTVVDLQTYLAPPLPMLGAPRQSQVEVIQPVEDDWQAKVRACIPEYRAGTLSKRGIEERVFPYTGGHATARVNKVLKEAGIE